ncbi:MAG TPA: hypothetical protein VGM44_07105 [Polyangiaceae bacterium]|jgi:hypothetical protein
MGRGRASRAWAERLATALGIACVSATAKADPHLQAVGETSIGYTDNFRNTPESALVAGPPRATGAFLTLSPSVVLALESQRAVQRVSYRYEYDLFLAQTTASGSTNQVDYHGFFELSPRLTMLLDSSASETNRYAAVAFSAPAASTVAGLPAGTGAFAQGNASASLNYDMAPSWRGWQSANALVESPILGTSAPQTSEVQARTGVERSFLSNSAGLELRPDYTVVRNTVAPNGSPAGTQEQLVVNGVALWRHDWGRDFTSSAEAGAARVQRFNTGRGFWTPTGSLLFAFANQSGDAQLSYAHAVSTNALLGQTLLADEVRVRGGLPLTPDNRLLLAVTAGYERGRLIDESANLAARVATADGDVTLGFQATKLLELALKYQHIQQVSDAAAPPLPLSFTQNNVLASAIFKFPPDRDMPRPYRAPLRIDRSDEIRDGAEAAPELEKETQVPTQ